MSHRQSPGRRAFSLFVAVVALCLGLGLARRAGAATPVTIDAANHAFAEGRYGEAAADFEQLIAQHGYSAPLLFDLGNAYLRDGRSVPAVLALERARLLAPRDPAIAANLAAAGAPDRRSLLVRGAHVVSMSAWAWLVAGGVWIGAAALGASALAKRRRPLALSLAGLAGVLALTSAAALGLASRDLHEGIVMTSAPVLLSPFSSAQSDFSLPAGARVQLGRARDGYVFVHDDRDRAGWVERAQVEPLIVRAS